MERLQFFNIKEIWVDVNTVIKHTLMCDGKCNCMRSQSDTAIYVNHKDRFLQVHLANSHLPTCAFKLFVLMPGHIGHE